VGIFGLQDPLRPTIKDSIAKCKKAGITVIMCTGDNLDTAKAISINAGIVEPEEALYTKEKDTDHELACLTGQDFRMRVG